MPVRTAVALLLALLPPLALHAQADPDAEAARVARARAALAPLAALVGEWEGEATVLEPGGRRLVVSQHEDVVWGAGGTVLIIRGTGRSTEAADRGRIVFEAAAIVWFDQDSGKVRMRTHRGGGSVEPEMELRPDTLVWGFPVTGGRIRYTIAFDAERWHEVGHFVRAGGQAIQTIEMRLRRTRR